MHRVGVAVAYLELDPLSKNYRLRFRYAGRQYKRSLKTGNAREARAIVGRVEETILLLERGRMQMPADADPATYILTDGRLGTKAKAPEIVTLGELIDRYNEQLPEGVKEATTRKCETTHQKHLLRLLKARTVLRTLKPADLQNYLAKRLKDRYYKRKVTAETVKKELGTFRMMWNWAVNQELLEGMAPVRGLQFPKRDEKPPFMTLADAERILKRGGLSKAQEKAIWDSVYLTREDVHEVLEHVRTTARHAFLYPMFVFLAHTGARRSEVLNSRIEDFDFAAGQVMLREKKKSRKLGTTFRHVDLTPLLSQVMQDWFREHPGGPYTMCDANRLAVRSDAKNFESMNPVAAQKHFHRVLKGSRWERLRGFHVFRHSFASNLASLGVDQRIIDDFLGHTTEEMRRRYRHLIPATKKSAIALLMPEPALTVVSA